MRTKGHMVTIFSLACITCKRRHTRDLFSAARPVEIESSQSHGQFPGQKAAGRDNGRAGLHQGRHQQQGQMTTLPSSSFPLAKLMFSLSSALYPARWSRPEDDPAGRRCRQVWYDPGSNSCYFAHSVNGAAEAATARVGAIGIVNVATDEIRRGHSHRSKGRAFGCCQCEEPAHLRSCRWQGDSRPRAESIAHARAGGLVLRFLRGRTRSSRSGRLAKPSYSLVFFLRPFASSEIAPPTNSRWLRL